MAITVNDYQDLVRLIRQRPEWQVELRHLLLDEDFLALPRIVQELAEAQRAAEVRLTRIERVVGELAEAQRRTETRVGELAEAQRRTEARVEELAEAQRATEARLTRIEHAIEELIEIQKRSEVRLINLEQTRDEMLNHMAQIKGKLLERHYADYAPSYFGKWVRRIRVVVPGRMDAETERRLAEQLDEDELGLVLRLDLLARGELHKPAALAGQEVWLATEISLMVDREDVRRARERAGFLRKAGLRAIPVVAGAGITQGASEQTQGLPIVVMLDGRVTGWDEVLTALQDEK